MKTNDFLKRFNEFIEAVYTTSVEVQKLTNDKEYLQRIQKNIAILKLENKISQSNIDNIIDELITEYSRKYNIKYKYNGDYISTINVIVSDIEILINEKIQDKLNEVAIKRLLEEALENNE